MNFQEVLENEYLKVFVDKGNSVIKFVWQPESENMTGDDYKEQVNTQLELTKKHDTNL